MLKFPLFQLRKSIVVCLEYWKKCFKFSPVVDIHFLENTKNNGWNWFKNNNFTGLFPFYIGCTVHIFLNNQTVALKFQNCSQNENMYQQTSIFQNKKMKNFVFEFMTLRRIFIFYLKLTELDGSTLTDFTSMNLETS